ncbi:MAG: archease [Desulfohalobiaceae bacterium]
MARSTYETFEHGADIGVRGWGKTMPEAFANGARAMFSIIAEDLDAVQPLEPVPVTASSYDMEGLFVSWLNALLAAADLKRMLFCTFKVNISGLQVRGTAWGQRLGKGRDRGVEVKGATFTELRVQREGGGWTAQCVVDV